MRWWTLLANVLFSIPLHPKMEIILPSLAWVIIHLYSDAMGLPEFPCDLLPILTPVGRAYDNRLRGTHVPVHNPRESITVILCVHLAEPWCPDTWSNIILDVAVKAFFSCD